MISDFGHPDVAVLLSLFVVGNLAGFVDSVAGGGGLLTLPALLWAGLDPAQALATNKLQGSFGTASASLTFMRAGTVHPGDFRPAIATTFIGATVGVFCVQRIDPGLLRSVIPILLLIASVFFWFMPRGENAPRIQRISDRAYAVSVAPALGFYDGFFGPGTGSFIVLSQVALLGRPLMSATAHAKILNFTSNVASLLIFLAGGKTIWSAGLVMAAGQILGARLGSRLVLVRGAALVRPILVVVSLAIALRLFLTA